MGAKEGQRSRHGLRRLGQGTAGVHACKSGTFVVHFTSRHAVRLGLYAMLVAPVLRQCPLPARPFGIILFHLSFCAKFHVKGRTGLCDVVAIDAPRRFSVSWLQPDRNEMRKRIRK